MEKIEFIELVKSILKLIFTNFSPLLKYEANLSTHFESLLKKIDSITNFEELEIFKKDVVHFFEIFSYFFDFDIQEERKAIKEIIFETHKIIHHLEEQLKTFKNRFRDLQEKIEKIEITKECEEVIDLMKNEITHILNFIEFFSSELKKLKTKVSNIEQNIFKFDKKISDLKKKAFIDELTGVFNRRALEVKLKNIFENFIPKKSNFAVIFFDIDNFKEINDNYGHLVGDLILKKIAKLMKASVRENDMIFRFGGDEFVILIMNVPKEVAINIGKRIIEKIKKGKFIYEEEKEIKIKVSGGLYYVSKKEDPEEVIKKADLAMYKAKNTEEKFKIIE